MIYQQEKSTQTDQQSIKANKLIEEFCQLELGTKCAVLTRLLSNLQAHIDNINGNYEELLQEIIKISKGG